jgi:hypothetical protein
VADQGGSARRNARERHNVSREQPYSHTCMRTIAYRAPTGLERAQVLLRVANLPALIDLLWCLGIVGCWSQAHRQASVRNHRNDVKSRMGFEGAYSASRAFGAQGADARRSRSDTECPYAPAWRSVPVPDDENSQYHMLVLLRETLPHVD